jgi:hypothetical protein
VEQLLVHYRPLDQTADWKQIPMTPLGAGRFGATIPGEALSEKYDLQYYFEAQGPGGKAWLYPSWERRSPYFVIAVHSSGATHSAGGHLQVSPSGSGSSR